MSTRFHNSGFSLVELLVVITAIAVLVTVAIAAVGNVIAAASRSSAKRNAQNMASVFATARASGYTSATTDLAPLASELTNGISVTNGGQIVTFRIDGLTSAQVTAAGAFLSATNSELVYNPGTN